MIKYFILSLLLVGASLSYTCPSQCANYFDDTASTAGQYKPGCDSGSSTCTHCDNQYFQSNGTNCVLIPAEIYNTTQRVSVDNSNWFKTDDSHPGTTCGSNLIKITSNREIYQKITITANSSAIYGLRVRFVIEEGSSLNDMELDLYVNNQLTAIKYCATNNNQYNMALDKSWVYTSPFIAYHDQDFKMWLVQNNIAGDDICIPDMILLIA